MPLSWRCFVDEAADFRLVAILSADLRFAAGFSSVFVCAVSSSAVSGSTDGWGVISASDGRAAVSGSTVGSVDAPP